MVIMAVGGSSKPLIRKKVEYLNLPYLSYTALMSVTKILAGLSEATKDLEWYVYQVSVDDHDIGKKAAIVSLNITVHDLPIFLHGLVVFKQCDGYRLDCVLLYAKGTPCHLIKVTYDEDGNHPRIEVDQSFFGWIMIAQENSK